MRQGKRRIAALASTLLIALVTFAPAAAQPGQSHPPGNEAFERTWARTDYPVQELQAQRTWMWGPSAFTTTMNEPYAESMTGVRTVQYFDKSRMEINNPNADPNALWYVTNGLLVNELMTGQMQVGDDQFETKSPAEVNIAGDPGFDETPTYATYGELMDDAPYAEGALINQTLARDGTIGQDTDLDEFDVTAGPLVPNTNHRVASVFWEFLNSSGIVWENNQFVNDLLFENAFYASGYPKTEAYWAYISVDGTPKWVLTQAFERRVLTYTPDNNAGWQVEAGNVGQHYYIWRYTDPGYPTGDYYVQLNSLGDSGVFGAALIHIADNGDMTVTINAAGMTPDQVHMQHIHVAGVEEAGLQQADLCEVYGDVVFPLTPYPTASADGAVTFEETYVEVDWAALGNTLDDKVIVLHGIEEGEDYNAGTAVACGEFETPPLGMSEYHVDLAELSGSGASGTAHITLDGPRMHVEVNMSGVAPDQIHMQHIHLTEASVDCDNYGLVIFPLTPYPTADNDGNYTYEADFIVNLSHLGDLLTRVVVVHGIMDGEEYDAGEAIACGVIESGPPTPPPDFPTGDFYVELNALGDSGVSGAAYLQLSEDGTTLEVDVQAMGLTPDQVHMQHIHLVTDPEADDPCSVYGEVIFPFEPYPTANAGGQVIFNETYDDVDIEVLGDLLTRVVVLHGFQAEGEDYDAATPVACGVIQRPPLGMSEYHVNLNELDDSGVVGAASISLDGPWMHVQLNASGTTPEQVHAMHIHLVTDPEAEDPCTAYGAVIFPFTPYPTADSDGAVSQDQTYLVNLSAIGDLTTRVVVVHGFQAEGAEYDPATPVACGGIQQAGEEPADYGVTLAAVGDSGASGTGHMTLLGGTLTVTLDMDGVTPDEEHFQHIHVVELEEGETDLCANYFGILMDLDPFPTADAEGVYSFEESYLVNTDELGDLTTRVVVVHGLLVDEQYDAGLAVACGPIVELVAE